MGYLIIGFLTGVGLTGAVLVRVWLTYPARQCPECGAEVEGE